MNVKGIHCHFQIVASTHPENILPRENKGLDIIKCLLVNFSLSSRFLID